MTLFRKVFQNQSRPATGDEALDEEALRDAFMETSERSVLPLDPFAVSDPASPVRDEEAEGAVQVDPEAASPEAQEEAPAGQAVEDSGAADIAAVLAKTRMTEQPVVAADVAPEAELPLPDGHQEDVSDNPKADTAETLQVPGEGQSDVVAFAREQLRLSGGPVPEGTADEPAPVDLSTAAPLSAVPDPAAGRSGRRAGRVKTRMLGFNRTQGQANDPFDAAADGATAQAQHEKFPVGWLVIVEGPGVGHSFSIFTGASMIGRGEDQVIRLDFGDNSISRHHHAAIAYDEEQNKFYIGYGGKSNIVRRNARPVLGTEELQHADLIRIGETTLRFVALCGSDFKWDEKEGDDAPGL